MKSWIRCLIVLVACCWQMSVRAADTGMRLLTEEYPPYNMTLPSGQIGGISSDVLRELFKRAGIPYRLEILPWIRAFNLAILDRNTCVFSTTRTENREHQFKWVGPLVENVWVLYAGPRSPKNIYTLEAIRPYTVGGYDGDAESQDLIGRGFNIELTPVDEMNARKLAAGRIDFWATSKARGGYLIAKGKVQQLKPVLAFNTVLLYLACNPGVSDMTIQQLNNLLDTMRHEGFIDLMHKRYGAE